MKSPWSTAAAALLLAGLLAAPAAAQLSGLEDPIVADRPDFTEGTSILDTGHFQLEGGYTFTRLGEEESHTFGELLLRYGFSQRIELRLEAGSYDRIETDGAGERISGFEDPGIGLKLRLTDAATWIPGQPAVAVVAGTSVPVGDEELTSDAWEPSAVLAFDWELFDLIGLGANLGAAALDGEDGRFTQVYWSASGGYGLTERLSGYLEYYGISEDEEGGPSLHYLDAGLTYLIHNDLQVDIRVGRGLNGEDPDDYIGVGAAVRW
jgi:hypothetical protein